MQQQVYLAFFLVTQTAIPLPFGNEHFSTYLVHKQHCLENTAVCHGVMKLEMAILAGAITHGAV